MRAPWFFRRFRQRRRYREEYRRKEESLSEGMRAVIASARATSEYEPIIVQLVDCIDLHPGSGIEWKEVLFNKL